MASASVPTAAVPRNGPQPVLPPMKHARVLVGLDKPNDAAAVLRRAIARGDFSTTIERATAELAIAIAEMHAEDPEAANTRTSRTECELVLTDDALHPVRWDLRLARIQALRLLGRDDEAVDLARDTLALFETSELPTGFHRPMLVEVFEASRSRDGYEPGWLIARAGGTLRLHDSSEGHAWLKRQEFVFSELLAHEHGAVAVEHVAGAIRALPPDLFGELYWLLLMRLIGRVSQACDEAGLGHEAQTELMDAFAALEAEFSRIGDYEDEALLLPRARVLRARPL